jgi:hypothetical protein
MDLEKVSPSSKTCGDCLEKNSDEHRDPRLRTFDYLLTSLVCCWPFLFVQSITLAESFIKLEMRSHVSQNHAGEVK